MIKNMRAIPPWELKQPKGNQGPGQERQYGPVSFKDKSLGNNSGKMHTMGPGSMGPGSITALPSPGIQNPIGIQRPSPEIERRLKKVEEGVQRISTPVGNDGTGWIPTTEVLYIAYASALSNLTAAGTIPNQSDCTNFGYTAFTDAGVLFAYRGRLVSTSVYASGDSTDYIWEPTNLTVANTTYERKYSKNDALLTAIGDPDNPGTGITWINIAPAAAIPATAYWAADRFSIDGAVSQWQIYPVRTGQSANLGIITFTKNENKPTLNDSTWKTDVLLAATANTGLAYSLHTELGFGAVVVITYNNGKVFGILRDINGTATWQVPTSIVDGDLVVDGTIVTNKIAANAITGAKISAATTITAGTGNNVGVLDGSSNTGNYRIYAGHATPGSAPFRVNQAGVVTIDSGGSSKLVISGDTLEVFNSGTLRVKIGNLA